MASINTGRVIAGGLVAGVVGNVLDMTWNFTLLKDDMAAMAARFGMSPDYMNSFSAGLPWIVVDFIFGLVIVWNYAAMRPRFGPGPKTAVFAGLVPFIAVSAVLYGFTSMGMMPSAAFVKGTMTSLISTVAASIAGAWVYKE